MRYLAFLFLLGCTALPTFTKPGVTQQQASADKYGCARETTTVLPVGTGYTSDVQRAVDRRNYALCMEARGYVRE